MHQFDVHFFSCMAPATLHLPIFHVTEVRGAQYHTGRGYQSYRWLGKKHLCPIVLHCSDKAWPLEKTISKEATVV